LVLKEGDTVCGTPHEVDGVPWLELKPETMRLHPDYKSTTSQQGGWAMIATKNESGLGVLLRPAPTEMVGWLSKDTAKKDVVWEVLCKGGLSVSVDKDKSLKKSERLEVGALVKELDYVDGRLSYQLVAGYGPEFGWVDTSSVAGKQRIEKVAEAWHSREKAAAEVSSTTTTLETPKQDPAQVEEALQEYSQQLHLAREGIEDGHFSGDCFPVFAWQQGENALKDEKQKPEAEVCVELEQALMVGASATSKVKIEKNNEKTYLFAEDSDGEEVHLCNKCRLPMGSKLYLARNKKGCVHAECMADEVVIEMKEQEEAQKEKNARKNELNYELYDIGWKTEHIPSNLGAASCLAGHSVPHGMCCLVWDESTGSVRAAPTMDPAAAVNLEYLSIALKVRYEEGREPEFSLDPVDGNDKSRTSMLVKRFEPYWLKETKVGEVLFQSDFYLKEVSMGHCEQPVIGMKSANEYAAKEKDEDCEWDAREWFVVKAANVLISEDGALIPYCKLSVEAREQTADDKGRLHDVKMTRRDHPMVKYAESFSHNFDLIAERSSVIYHLRELAKASILAKYLHEAGADLEPFWQELHTSSKQGCPMEIPQLWNYRSTAQIKMQDVDVLNAADGFQG